jgi:death-on-curing protein
MISLNEIEKIHGLLIDTFGGTHGIRDRNALESAIQRPFATFESNDLYPTAVLKAAAVFESIISNHPFVDGNKRVAFVVMRLLLQEYKIDIKTSENKKYQFVIAAASGKLSFEQISNWITNHIIKL